MLGDWHPYKTLISISTCVCVGVTEATQAIKCFGIWYTVLINSPGQLLFMIVPSIYLGVGTSRSPSKLPKELYLEDQTLTWDTMEWTVFVADVAITT